jgi:hypothetical protein
MHQSERLTKFSPSSLQTQFATGLVPSPSGLQSRSLSSHTLLSPSGLSTFSVLRASHVATESWVGTLPCARQSTQALERGEADQWLASFFHWTVDPTPIASIPCSCLSVFYGDISTVEIGFYRQGQGRHDLRLHLHLHASTISRTRIGRLVRAAFNQGVFRDAGYRGQRRKITTCPLQRHGMLSILADIAET